MRCDVGVDAGNSALPVVGTGALAAIRKSKRSKWRAATLVSVHALIAAHLAHFMTTGRTLSPVEPSEAVFTIDMGYVTTGCIFFAVALLGTLIFGRFFCGWGCHIVALQDLCAWIMKKLGVRPRPFRSRLLAFFPLALALYMFAWPALRRLFFDHPSGPFAGFTNHLLTDSIWATFPGPTIAALTFLTCGFAAVYFLGAKGFCTYGCPYGALFGPLDTLATGRIVVSDACEQCGHCTATCTSNVRVHEEVKLYGMVVDSGCMKCMDCVSVCPKGALRFAFAKPSLFKRKPSLPRAGRYDLPLAEEFLVGAICLLATWIFLGLYDGPPLLMAGGLGGLTAFVSLKALHLLRKPNVQIQSLTLKSAGKLRGRGWLFATLALLWLSFTVQSAFVQWHRVWGIHYLRQIEASRNDIVSGAFAEKQYSPRHYRAAAQAFRHLSLADRFGFRDVMGINLGLSWAYLLRGDQAAAEAHARRAVAVAPDRAALTTKNLFNVLVARGKIPEAIETMLGRRDFEEPSAADRLQLAGLLVGVDRLEEAAHQYGECVAMAPDSAEAQYGLGDALRRLGRYDEALEHLLAAERISPADADIHAGLGLTYMAMGSKDEALRSLRRALELRSKDAQFSAPLLRLIERLASSNSEKRG